MRAGFKSSDVVVRTLKYAETIVDTIEELYISGPQEELENKYEVSVL